MQSVQTPQQREQILLFPKRLVDVLPVDNTARLWNKILSRIDYS